MLGSCTHAWIVRPNNGALRRVFSIKDWTASALLNWSSSSTVRLITLLGNKTSSAYQINDLSDYLDKTSIASLFSCNSAKLRRMLALRRANHSEKTSRISRVAHYWWGAQTAGVVQRWRHKRAKPIQCEVLLNLWEIMDWHVYLKKET